MIIIGLCGGSGAGKGTVARLFLKHGIPSIDADAVYRDLIWPGSSLLNSLADTFGAEIIDSTGNLDRKKLAAAVFSDIEKRKLLNSITHAAIIRETESRIKVFESQKYPAVIFDAPLLFESGFDKKCDTVIAVVASEDVRISRLTSRDGITSAAAKQRISSQLPDEFLIEHSDFVIENNSDAADLQRKVDDIVKIILK